ncbi:MAG TPA: response regulator [Verrucomicrobiae bacterium]|nr:response regulator [Verrucomicrobiae bacterium]
MQQDGLILIADDSEDDLLLLKRAFVKTGVLNPIHVVKTGSETVAYLKGDGKYADREQFPFPTILLLDLHMPEGDGFDVLKWIRDKSASGGPLIIVLSRLDEIKNINRAYALGANSFLTKPGDPAELQQLIKTFHGYWLLRNKAPRFDVPEGW